MSLPKYIELSSIETKLEIDEEIFMSQKNLFDLRLKQSRRQTIKPHLFIHIKRRISQLKFKKTLLERIEREILNKTEIILN